MSQPLPLAGIRVALTRPAESGVALGRRLEVLGAEVLSCPAIRRAPPISWEPLDRGIAAVLEGHFDGVLFTSPAAVEPFWLRLKAAGGRLSSLEGLFIGAVGAGTAAALARIGVQVDVVPEQEDGASLAVAVAETMGEEIRGRRFLQPRAEGGRAELADGLEERDAMVEARPAYRTLRVAPAELAPLVAALHEGRMEVVVFASPSAVDSLLAVAGPAGMERVGAVSIGTTTAGALVRAGVSRITIARRSDDDGLLAAVRESVSR